MTLTGKCKEDFENWFDDNYEIEPLAINYIGRFKTLPNSFRYSVYVDFFDSVGIFLSINYASNITMQGSDWFHIRVHSKSIYDSFNNRQEARAKAIEKANEIYNGQKI